jgi:hypothetical protein
MQGTGPRSEPIELVISRPALPPAPENGPGRVARHESAKGFKARS